MRKWKPEDLTIDIELTVNGINAEYTVFYDHTYISGYVAPGSGTSMAEYPDMDAEHEFSAFEVEDLYTSELISVSAENERIIECILQEKVKEL